MESIEQKKMNETIELKCRNSFFFLLGDLTAKINAINCKYLSRVLIELFDSLDSEGFDAERAKSLIKLYNDKISDLQEELENKDLYEMKQKFFWELLDAPYTYKERSSLHESYLRNLINTFIELRDNFNNRWNRLNASCARLCSDTMH